jgi:hypothetical protein
VHRRGVELEEAMIGQGGGRRTWRSVDQGAAVSVGTTQGEAEVGVSIIRRRKGGAHR